ncbi:MAG TPA: AAA family ATPase [Bacteroidales bacterium]|nr:AAA family ATPase [Bacteroidales bacterium]
MDIVLKQIHISNFKGIKDLKLDFGPVTNIMADNARGKTSIFDAFCWVLFNKDSFGNSKFGIRPIDQSGNNVDYIDIAVKLTLLIDGNETIIQKVQKQKWVKKRGSENSTFEGNINEYEWNGFPKSEKDFNESMAEIITDSVFMITTNPAFFPNMKWKEQRQALMELVSEIQDEDVIATDDKFLPLVDMLQENNIDAWRDKYAKALKEYNKQIDAIPNRIDEVSRNIKEIDYSSEELRLGCLKKQLLEIESQIEDSSKGFEDVLKAKQELFDLKMKIQEVENNAKKEHKQGLLELTEKQDKLNNEFNNLQKRQQEIRTIISESVKQRELEQSNLEKTRERFISVNAEALEDQDKHCPTCEQALPEDKINKIIEDFKTSKNKRLLDIRDQGQGCSARIKELDNEIYKLEKEKSEVIKKKTICVGQTNDIDNKLKDYPELNLAGIPGLLELEEQCKDLEYKLSTYDNGNDLTAGLKAKKLELQAEIEEVKKTLNNKEAIDGAKERVKELKEEQRGLAQKVADTEKMIFLFEEFIKAKMDMLSDTINSKFELVKWKLFDVQINGGLKETCELTLNGVPYSNLNSAAKVQAGLDIINTMSAIYDVTAPIFIDNREGVNRIPCMDSQIINLIVTMDQEIRVEVA